MDLRLVKIFNCYYNAICDNGHCACDTGYIGDGITNCTYTACMSIDIDGIELTLQVSNYT